MTGVRDVDLVLLLVCGQGCGRGVLTRDRGLGVESPFLLLPKEDDTAVLSDLRTFEVEWVAIAVVDWFAHQFAPHFHREFEVREADASKTVLELRIKF